MVVKKSLKNDRTSTEHGGDLVNFFFIFRMIKTACIYIGGCSRRHAFYIILYMVEKNIGQQFVVSCTSIDVVCNRLVNN